MIKYKDSMNSYIFIQSTITNGYPRKGMFFNNPIKNFFFRVNEQNAKAKTVAIANRKRSLLDSANCFWPFCSGILSLVQRVFDP